MEGKLYLGYPLCDGLANEVWVFLLKIVHASLQRRRRQLWSVCTKC